MVFFASANVKNALFKASFSKLSLFVARPLSKHGLLKFPVLLIRVPLSEKKSFVQTITILHTSHWYLLPTRPRPYRWSLVSHMVSVRLTKKHAIALKQNKLQRYIGPGGSLWSLRTGWKYSLFLGPTLWPIRKAKAKITLHWKAPKKSWMKPTSKNPNYLCPCHLWLQQMMI